MITPTSTRRSFAVTARRFLRQRQLSPVITLLTALIGTFVITRVSLSMSPNADVHIAGFNVHHLFTGVVILTICCVPLAVAQLEGIVRQALVVGLGIGLALALDEVVYLIATDGSNTAYLTPISWVGAIMMILLTSGYALTMGLLRRPSNGHDGCS